MSLGFRGKVFAISLGLMMLAGLSGAIALERELTQMELRELEQELARHARTASQSFATLARSASAAEIDELADRLGRASSARITFIDRSGRVLGDSSLTLDEIARVENHGHRPEVRAALAGKESVISRDSTTVSRAMLYAAAPLRDEHGAVRAAMPLDSVHEILRRLRTLMAFAAGLGLLVAVALAAAVSLWTGRWLGTFSSRVRGVVSGGSERLPVSEDELGTIAGSLNRLADERSETIRALVKERDRLNAVLSGVRESLIALDAQGRVELANPATMRLFGLSSSPEGKKLVEVVRVPALVELAEQGRTGAANVELSLGDPPRYVLASTTPLRATGGVVIVMHDVTDSRNMESMRRDLVANVSHELRTPVSILRANAETLLDGALEDPAQAKSFVQAMLRHSERLSSLLSDLLDLARIEGGAYPVSLESISLRDAARRAADTLARVAKTRNVKVDVEIASELRILADNQALDQVLVNLLDNAIKYSFEGGSVHVSARIEGERARLVVSDDGPGIQERHRVRIFERFYRVDAGRSRAVGGTGLGLSIVKHLVSLMHGQVGVDPVSPHGSAFWVTLPCPAPSIAVSPDRGDHPAA